MAVEQERRVGVRGLNLGADPADLAEGALTIADGARYLELGAVSSKGGRVKTSLDWPIESGFTTSTSYVDNIPHMASPVERPRGLTAYYDQRIWPFDSGGTAVNIPQRLNFVYKAHGAIHFNQEGFGLIFIGDAAFKDANTRAKFVVHGTDIYIVDESTRPKIWRRRKAADQASGVRVKYDVRPMGIIWPTATNQVPVITTPNAGPGTLYSGVYRFKLQLENDMGDLSGTTVNVISAIPGVAGQQTLNLATLNLDWSTITSTFPTGYGTATRMRIYVSYTASYVAWAEPSEFKLWKTVPIATTSALFTEADFNKMTDGPPMAGPWSYPPILKDLTIAAGRSFGISMRDSLYRELLINEGGSRVAGGFTGRQEVNLQRKWFDNTEIRKQEVDESFVHWSDAGEYQYMPNWSQIGDGTEKCVGLAPLGASCVVFTNKGIYVIDPNEPSVRKTPSTVGAISRDSIILTERGIRFIGTDGVPRLFNGATVDEVADQLLPIFDRDDYVGYYQRFDKEWKNEVVGTYGDRKFWMLYPVAAASGTYKPGVPIDPGVPRNLAIGDESRGPTMWSVDTARSYTDIYWIGEESRLLGVDPAGYFYWLEEGLLEDEYGTDSTRPYFSIGTRRFSAGSVMAQFYAVLLDIETQDETVTLECRVDGISQLVKEYSINTFGRQEVKCLLPSTFKGRFLDVRLYGSPSLRVTLYGILVEAARRGEIS